MSCHGQLQPAPIPPECYQQAANLARWFPEVLLTLGAPCLEETCAPPTVHVADDEGGRTVEVVLERIQLPGPGAAANSSPVSQQRDIFSTLAGLSALTDDYEALALHATLAAQSSLSSPHVGGVDTGLFNRLQSAAESLLTLSHCLASCNAASPRAAVSVGPEVPSYVPRAAPSSASGLQMSGDARHPAQTPLPRLGHHAASCPLLSSAATASCPADTCACKEENTPISGPGTRGGHQGRQGSSVRQAGRSRASAANAVTRSIAVSKVSQLSEEPASPKFHTATKAWGQSSKSPRQSPLPVDTEVPKPCEKKSKAKYVAAAPGAQADAGEQATLRRHSAGARIPGLQELIQNAAKQLPNTSPKGSGQASPLTFGESRSAAATKERIDKKLSAMFGGKVDPKSRHCHSSAPL